MRRFVASLRARASARVFALDHEVVQVDWTDVGAPVTVGVGGEQRTVDRDGPGACTVAVDGPVRVVVRAGADLLLDEVVRPLRPPPGPELHRLATISDLHFGSVGFDRRERMREVPAPEVPHWARCTDAALTALEVWGARTLLVKGDLTHRGHREAWERAADALGTTSLPVHAIPGNHDTHPDPGRVDPYRATDPGHLRIEPWVEVVDVPGLRVLLCNTTIPHRGRGRLGHLLPALTDLAADARRDGRPVLLAGHHQVNPAPVPVFWPIGIAVDDGERTLAAVRRANPRVAYTAGHTHRHRRRDVAGVPHIEVGSPKDHPGTWAGYAVFEGGLLQTVRRIERPDCIAWTEHTRRAALGCWRHWSPGHLSDRCFVLGWLDGAGWSR